MAGFPLPDLIIESILRDGMEDIRRDPEALEDVFAPLTQPYAERKYGTAEIEKIKQMVMRREVAIVHTWYAMETKIPCISIQLAEDSEKIDQTYLGDRKVLEDVPFTSPDQLAGLVRVSDIDPISYDSQSGIVSVPDTVNLAEVHVNLLFIDAAGTEHVILGGISNSVGGKQFQIDSGVSVDLGAGATINSSIDFDRYSKNQTAEQMTIILGIHTKEPLITKYLYVLVKYFLLSRKKDLCSRGIDLSTYSGSDFTRDLGYEADQVYTRFLHVHGILRPTWRADKVQLVDNINVNVKVPRDKYGNDIIGIEDQTVQVSETDQDDC